MYTSPDFITEYADGNKFQIVGFSFEAQVTGGELGLSDETTDYGYFTPDQIESMDLSIIASGLRMRWRGKLPRSCGEGNCRAVRKTAARFFA